MEAGDSDQGLVERFYLVWERLKEENAKIVSY